MKFIRRTTEQLNEELGINTTSQVNKLTQAQINDLISNSSIDKIYHKHKKIIKNQDFTNCDLSNLDLSGIMFIKCTFDKTNLSNCDLRQTQIKKQKCNNANFSNADMREADLSGSELQNANFTGANWWKITIIEGDLSWSKLGGVILKCANLFGSDLTDTILEGLRI